MNKNAIIKLAGMAVAIVFVIAACKKTKITIPPAEAHFIGAKIQNYAVRNTTPPPFVITLGTTNIANEDRTVTVTVTSSTGAVAGTQYTLNIGSSNTVTIPAGESRATFSVQGILAGYPAGRVDTLTFTLSEPGVKPAGFDDNLKLALGDICTEADIVVAELAGDYNNTFDDASYGPYLTQVVSTVSTGSTSATVTIRNIFDFGWNDLDFNLDWSDPANPTLTFDPQATGLDAGNLNAAVAGHEVWIYPPSGGGSMGTYSYCDNTFVINYRLCMPTFGACFSGQVQTTMAR